MEIQSSIIKTLAFFNLFIHPLTNFELHQLLYTQKPVDFFTVLKEAESLKPKIQAQDGFFSFDFAQDKLLSPLSSFDGGGEENISPPISLPAGRQGGVRGGLLPVEAIQEQGPHLTSPNRGGIKRRQERAIAHDKKFQIAQKAAHLISWVPFVKLVAVCNTLSFGAAEEGSDIDFFIIGKKGRLWTVRFFVMAILSFLRLRRRGQRIKDRICLSFYLADDNLNLQSIALPDLPLPPPRRVVGASSSQGGDNTCPPQGGDNTCPPQGEDNTCPREEEGGSTCPPLTKGGIKGGLPDIYLIYWIIQLVPLINRDQTLEKFWQANGWVKNYLANFSFESQLPNYQQIRVSAWVEGWRRWHEKIMRGCMGNWREKIFRFGQYVRIHSRLAQKINIGDQGVVINEGMIKLHESERRDWYRQRWLESYQRYEK